MQRDEGLNQAQRSRLPRSVARTYLVKRGFQFVVLQALLDQRDQRMGFDVARKRKTLRIWEPCTLQ